MAARDRDEGREVRIEGPFLWAASLVVAASLGGAFWLGRLYERGATPAPSRAVAADPLRNLSSSSTSDTDTLSFFDALSGDGREAEPARQVPAPSSPARTAATVVPEARGGPWFVQVFAGRDRRAAEQVVKSLGDRGHPVRLETEPEGTGALFKVRVGGFTSREAAETAAATLRGQGQSGAWVVRADGG